MAKWRKMTSHLQLFDGEIASIFSHLESILYSLIHEIRLQNAQVTNWLCYKVVWLRVGNRCWLIYGYKLSMLQSGIITKCPSYKLAWLQSDRLQSDRLQSDYFVTK